MSRRLLFLMTLIAGSHVAVADDESIVAPRPERAAIADKPHPLAATIERMRDAGQRMRGSETGEATQSIQRQVLADLDQMLAQSQTAGSSSAQPQASPDQEQAPESEAERTDERPTEGAQPGQGTTGTEQVQDSEEVPPQMDPEQAARARRQKVVGDVWGHLPERLRRELMNVNADQPLPEYADLVRRYFEALADPESANDGAARRP